MTRISSALRGIQRRTAQALAWAEIGLDRQKSQMLMAAAPVIAVLAGLVIFSHGQAAPLPADSTTVVVQVGRSSSAVYQEAAPVLSSSLVALGILAVLGVVLMIQMAHNFFYHRPRPGVDQQVNAQHTPAHPTQPAGQELEPLIAQRTHELQQSYALLQQYSSHLQNVLEEERTRVSQEIHDELGQALTGLKMDLHYITKQLTPDQMNIRERIATDMRLIDQTIVVMRRISSELRPGILDDLGLIATLEWWFEKFQERTDIEVSLILEPEDIDIPKELHAGLFRIIQEALGHLSHQSSVSQAWVTISQQAAQIRVDMRDNANVLTPDFLASTSPLGWLGIQMRASQLGGGAIIEDRSKTNAQLSVSVPVSGNTALETLIR